MTEELMSPNAFHWVLIAFTGGLAVSSLVCDALQLVKLHRADATDPQLPDKRFGCIIGIVIGILCAVGCVGYHLQLLA